MHREIKSSVCVCAVPYLAEGGVLREPLQGLALLHEEGVGVGGAVGGSQRLGAGPA